MVIDEPGHYLDTRYIGATEACWRIQEFPLRFRYPPLEMLSIHLPNEQNAIFKDSELSKEELQEIAQNNQTSQLTKFSQLNENDKNANAYTYDQILYY